MRVTKKILQTTLAYVITTLIGFLGTLYFARTLGPGPIGTFALGVSIVIWGTVFDFGLGISTVKRISEGNRKSAFFTASLILYIAVFTGYCFALILAQNAVDSYVGADVASLVILLFAGQMTYGAVSNGIKGLNAVHIKNWIDVLERAVRVAVQALLVVMGLSFVGLYVGYIVSIGIGLIVSIMYLCTHADLSLQLPTLTEFHDLFDFAKFSWLGRLKSQSISWMDIFILGFFATQSLVGVYQIAWTVSKTFGLLPKAIGSNIFPEVSGLGADDHERLEMLVREGLVYAGYVAIPGTVGAALLGRRVLGIYGPEFRSGAVVLVILSAAMAVRGYEQHLLRILDSIDRPELTFRVNLVFVATNTGMNVVLIWLYGPLGAAVATLASTTLSLILAGYATTRIVNIQVPVREVLNQIGAALGMGVVVAVLDTIIPLSGFVGLLILVGIGACTYFATTVVISTTIRQKSRSIILG